MSSGTLDAGRLHFLDESGIRVGETRRTGLSKPGQRIVEKVPTTHWDAITMIGTLGVGGVTSMATIDGALDGDAYAAYVEQVLVPVLEPGDVVVMDNLRVHSNAEAIEAIERAGARVLWLPPYSPDFNPIEQVWSKLKALVRAAGARTRSALDEAIADALSAITAANARAWFAYCGYSSGSAADLGATE